MTLSSYIANALIARPLNKKSFYALLSPLTRNPIDVEIELLKAKGFPLGYEDDLFFLKTTTTPLKDQIFCFVDIETTGARPTESQIIEIGALLYKNGAILDTFEEFIYAPFVPEMITEITHINADMLSKSRKIKEVLRDFKMFLGDSIFVAHNVGFDYGFLSYALEENGLGELLNAKLCTIDLAKRTIASKRYSLSFLNEFLGINTPISHRAYADALTALEVFKIAMYAAPNNLLNAQDLIAFSKSKI